MRASVFIATSLDGYIARLDGGLDWLLADGNEPHGFDEFMASVDALVIGRNTFEIVLAFPSWPYGSKPVFVLSSSMRELKAPEGVVCELMAGNPHDVVSQLAQRGIQHIYVDGGVTIQRFLNAGLIQRLIITRIPVLLGSGIPLFGPLSKDVRLQHVLTRALPNGLVQSEYLISA